MIDVEPQVPPTDARRRRIVSFCLGFVLGLGFNLVVIAGLVYLKLRDTSAEPWETLTLGALGAAVCISPFQLITSCVLTSIQRIRWLSVGLVTAGIVGVVSLVVLAAWSNEQADLYARLNHLS
jgi:hypothetical protein